jgi:phenylpropionate dioxygenase-like ring-hydroxylating dioxygenase large terminal subunit
VTFGGAPIALARSEGGHVFALDDRCAHRQFPLHQGIVCGEQLRCAYHAWSYHPDGRVASVPYLPKELPRPSGVRSYPCREAYGYVFVFPGEAAEAARVPLPALPQLDDPGRRAMHFWRRVDCHYSFMHENLMDMNHQFLHRGIMGTLRPTLLDFDRGDDWVEVNYRFRQAGGRPARGARFLLGGGPSADPAGPAGDVMTIRTQYPYQTLSIRRSGAREPAFDLWAVYVPEDRAQRSHISVGVLMIQKPRVPGLLTVLWPVIRRFAESVFAEDRMAVEAEQRAWDGQAADRNQEINPVILALREVLVRNGVAPAPAEAVRPAG